jgi:hypothetical protein
VDALAFNGIDGATGEYLFEPLAPEQIAARLGAAPDDAHAKELQLLDQRAEPHFGLIHRADAEDLSEAGWSVVLAPGCPDAVVDALMPLLDRRREQAGERWRELRLLPGESKQAFLARHGMGPGRANPDKVPYYLLLVGDPIAAPFRLQYELDVEYAVGRLALGSPDEYRAYAESVLAAEEVEPAGAGVLALFAPDADPATALSAQHLVAPLEDALAEAAGDWDVRAQIGPKACKERMARLLLGDDAPDLLFAACHGIGFTPGDDRRRERQGSLVTQDWPGPGHGLSDAHYLGARDVPPDAAVRAPIVMCFACYGAGTPAEDGSDGFVAALPQRLLASSAGGALAFIGHVDRALGLSFVWPDAGPQHDVFASTLLALVDGWRVGHAMEHFGSRYADITVGLNGLIDSVQQYHELVDPAMLASMWAASRDARDYVVFGDPAVRLPGRRPLSDGGRAI